MHLNTFLITYFKFINDTMNMLYMSLLIKIRISVFINTKEESCFVNI